MFLYLSKFFQNLSNILFEMSIEKPKQIITNAKIAVSFIYHFH